MTKSSILMIYTGGTIGMKQDPVDMTLKPFDFSQILDEVPELKKFAFRVDAFTFNPLIDSSDVEPSMWQKLADLIKERYDDYDGFVILHGTDTMAYSASALSFMLENLSKPVVFTGSQLPIGVPRTDGKENLVSAVEIASARDSIGHSIVPEVSIYFNSKLLRGNRSTKTSSEAFSAFSSPNFPSLAEAGISIKYDLGAIRRPDFWEEPLKISTELDTRVSILKIHPGITPQVMRYFLCGPETRAVILETYGSGNAPSKQWFTDIIREASEMGKIIMNVTQCLSGTVDMSIYATGKALKELGVISGQDITTEGALGKLFYLMGKSKDNECVKKRLGENLQGEISI
ncbi:MAG: type I asparaginase [Bacteroidales bacterium]|jgi:L-asparaginase|nr:type I asparaginase [Bacteroidales bacterium]MCH3941395.1 type I asparaginase [Bacteroidales bacterium]MDY6320345.1 type I asparaginase [Bacteroidales bacterium]MEE3389614.1 type I asparaginase [Candidatus Cryptobacteroides sp.]MEE3429305.1 type I asparaginase [Candidatus Cryptobacteroides sp.]